MRSTFLREYLDCFNATEAARRAGYKWPNKMGPQLKKELAGEIEELLAEKLMPLDEALAREAALARFDIGPYVKGTGDETRLDVEKMKRDGFGHLIRGIKKGRYGTTIETADPDAARRQIIKAHLSLRQATGSKDDPVYQVTQNIHQFQNLSDDDLYDTLTRAMAQLATSPDGDDGRPGD